MCRDKACGGRRCPVTDTTREKWRAASRRHYLRKKARATIAELAEHGITAVDDLQMDLTYHCGPPPERVSDAMDDSTMGSTKPYGALWTAPGTVNAAGDVSSTWTQYVDSEGMSRVRRAPRLGDPVEDPRPGQVVRIADQYTAPGQERFAEVLVVDRTNPRLDRLTVLQAGADDVDHIYVPARPRLEDFDDAREYMLAREEHTRLHPAVCLYDEPGLEHQAVTDAFAARFRSDEEFRKKVHATATAIAAGESPPLDKDTVQVARLMRGINEHTRPERLYQGLRFDDPGDRDAFVQQVARDGYEIPLGTFTRSPGNATDVTVETVGPVGSFSLPGDDGVVLSGGRFEHVETITRPDRGKVVRVRRVFAATPEAPTPAEAARRGYDGTTLIPVKARPGAVVVRIDSAEQVDALERRYPGTHGGLSFAAMARDGIDAVYLSEAGVSSLSGPVGADRSRFASEVTSSWNVASVAWLRGERLDVGEPVSAVPVAEPDWGWDDRDWGDFDAA